MVTTEGSRRDYPDGVVPDPERIRDRSTFAVELTLARERAGRTVRAVAREVGQPAATIGGYFSGQHLPPVRQTDLFLQILSCIGITGEQEVAGWLEALARVRRKPGPRAAASHLPYRGLESFGVDDAEWFFGRESLTETVRAKLAERVEDPADSASMIMVVGPSGSGKSSLLRAGVAPAVADGGLDRGVSAWQCRLLSPGDRPLRVLAEQLASVVGADPREIEADLRSGAFDLRSRGVPDGGLVIIIDQFEEIFTLCADASERDAFLSVVDSLSRDNGQLLLVAGLRADFYARAALEPVIVAALQEHQVVVGPMTAEQLRRAIIEPARLAGYEVDAELVDVLIGECIPRGSASGVHDSGALPLLSHALAETFRLARKGRMTVADYRETGGIRGAVSQSAEHVFAELTPGEQALARRVFLRLVNVDDEAIATRRRVARSELPASTRDVNGEDHAGRARMAGGALGDPGAVIGSLARVIDRFVSARLLTVHEETVEISHEALLGAWPRLGQWLDADRAGLRLRRQLSEAARVWAEVDQDPSELLRGGRLETALAWISSADHSDDLNELERSFLDSSAAHDRRERDAARRRARRLQVLVAVVAAMAAVSATLAAVALGARNSAVRARDMALSREVSIEAGRLRTSDPALAAQLALAGYRISPTPEARSALLDSSAVPTPIRLLGQPGATALAVTGDGRTLADSRATDGSVQLYSRPPSGEPVKRGILRTSAPGSSPFAAAFNPEGSLLAVGGTDDSVVLWDVADLDDPRPLAGPLKGFTEAVQSIAFSPNGHTLAAAGTAPGVLRWDVTVPAHPVSLSPLTPTAVTTQSVAFSPDGTIIAAGGTDGTVRLWDTRGPAPELLAQLPDAARTTVDSVAFSPNGRLLAAGNRDPTINVWDLSNLAAPTEVGSPLTGFTSWVNSVAFSPDGSTLAAGSSDSTIRFWDVNGWQPQATYLTSPAQVTAISFVPGTNELVSVAEDGTARLWPLPGPVIDGATDSIYSLMYSADGRRLAVVPTRDPTTEIWNTSKSVDPRLLGRVILPSGLGVAAGSGSISPDGQILATATSKGDVQLFDIADPAQPIVLGAPLAESDVLVEQVAFSPDGRLLAAGGDDNTIALWDITNPHRPAMLTRLTGPTNDVLGIAFSGNSRFLAAASGDKTVRLWNIADPKRPIETASLTGFNNYVFSVAFSADDHVLAAGSADMTVRLWDISDPQDPRPIGQPITGPASSVNAVAIDPAGRTLAAATGDGSVWLWDITNPGHPRHLATLNALPGQIFILAYSPDGHTLAAAGDERIVHLWTTDPDQVRQDICAATGDTITRTEWALYIPDRPYTPPCGGRNPRVSP